MSNNLLKIPIFIEDSKKAKVDSLFRGIEKRMYHFFAETAMENGYTDREKQYDMAEEVLDTIKENGELLVEAGVGIGKTFAYLVPALLYSHVTQKPIAIATSTIALQEQLKGDVEEVARMLGIRVEAVIAKGQTHYICTEKARNYKGPEADIIREALAQGCLQRSEFDVDDATWEKVRVDRYSRKCVMTCENPCGYHVLRSTLLSAQVTICNQNLLTMHRLHVFYDQAPILNEQIAVHIIDEAHNLESKVRECTQTELKKESLLSSIQRTFKSLHGYLRETIANDGDAAIRAVEDFFQDVYRQMREQDASTDSEIERYYYRSDEKNLLLQMQETVSAFYNRAELYLSLNDKTHTDDLEDAANSLNHLLSDPDNYVCWIEKSGAFCFCRENMAEVVADHYFSDDCPACILTSATLTSRTDGSLEDQYKYIMKSIGFNGSLSDPKESPFNYDEHAMIFVADRLPHPTKEHDEFIRQGTELLKEILQISEGRALVLFTAKKDMMEVYDELQKDSPYEIIIQKAGASQQETLDEFRRNEHAVLLGTGAYWEGINIEGQTLSNVIIFRLPFPVPDPIIDSREKHAKDPLMEVKVPEMIIKLKQGVGRLIRSESDKGIISIIDSRVGESSQAPYKEIVWNALPIKNRTGSLEEIRRFYRDIPKDRIVGWMSFPMPVYSVYDNPPMDLPEG